MQDLFEKIRKEVLSVSRVLIISHRKPDADTLGSALALKFAFEQWGEV